MIALAWTLVVLLGLVAAALGYACHVLRGDTAELLAANHSMYVQMHRMMDKARMPLDPLTFADDAAFAHFRQDEGRDEWPEPWPT